MAEVWVANASPLVVLAKTGNLGLLPRLCATVIVPQAVAEEVLAGPENDPARKALEAGWGIRSAPPDIPSQVREWGLGPGEEAVLAEALRRAGAVALLSRRARSARRKDLAYSPPGHARRVAPGRAAGPDPVVQRGRWGVEGRRLLRGRNPFVFTQRGGEGAPLSAAAAGACHWRLLIASLGVRGRVAGRAVRAGMGPRTFAEAN